MDVLMPQLGETVTEGTVITWFKSVGDKVAVGDRLFEIETDKVAMEVEATSSGTLAEICVPTGGTVPVGTAVAVIDDGVARTAAKPSPKPPPLVTRPMALPSPAVAPASPPRTNGVRAPLDPFFEVRTPQGNFGPAKGPLGIRVTPLARRLITQNGLDVETLAQAVKTRGGWRIGKADVLAALDARPAQPGPAPAVPAYALQPNDRVVPLNRVRKKTAEHLARAWSSIPHVMQAIEVDFVRISRLRDQAKEAFRARTGSGLTFLPFIARAACLALRDYPQINARLEGNELVLRGDVHLGIAVDLDHAGLVVPVLRHADGLTVAGLAKAIDRAVQKARAGALTAADLEDGTYTISNNGSFGTLFTAPIINAPQVAILSTDAITRRPVVVTDEDGERIVAPVGVLAQSFDHRAFDGAYSASFLGRVKTILETRDWTAELE